MDRSYWSYYAMLNILRDFGFVSQDGKFRFNCRSYFVLIN